MAFKPTHWGRDRKRENEREGKREQESGWMWENECEDIIRFLCNVVLCNSVVYWCVWMLTTGDLAVTAVLYEWGVFSTHTSSSCFVRQDPGSLLCHHTTLMSTTLNSGHGCGLNPQFWMLKSTVTFYLSACLVPTGNDAFQMVQLWKAADKHKFGSARRESKLFQRF